MKLKKQLKKQNVLGNIIRKKVHSIYVELSDKNLGDEAYVTDYVERLKSIEGVMNKWYKQSMKLDRKGSYKGFKNDTRSGEETYGYSSFKSIHDDLCYICDRCVCQFRIRWLIDLIDLIKLKEDI